MSVITFENSAKEIILSMFDKMIMKVLLSIKNQTHL
jgi:hypothetical protein